ncbi:MAG: hypothetical protein ACRENC_19295, partial [Gemmatimonadaceae bacterium]
MPALPPFITLSEPELIAFRNARHVVPVDDAVFALEGPGVLDCLQGLLTNDVVKPANRTATWGAFLTPKGMIITDAWVLRDASQAWVLVPAATRETVQ